MYRYRAMRWVSLFFSTVFLAGLLAGGALAESPQQECESAGGTFSKERGTQTCTIEEAPGNNQGGVTKEDSTSQKGSSRSSHPEETERCVNNNGGRHCPPGQQS